MFKKYIYLIVIIIFVLLGVWLLLGAPKKTSAKNDFLTTKTKRHKDEVSEELQASPTSSQNLHIQNGQKSSKMTNNTILATKSDSRISHFDDIEWTEKVQLFIDDIGSYIDKDKSHVMFINSDLNTVKTVSAAMQVTLTPYPEGINRAVLKSKVIALKILNYTNLLSIEKCNELLTFSISNFNKLTENEQLQRNILLDIYSLTKICGGIDQQFVIRLADQQQNKTIAAQMKMGLEVLHETDH